MNSCMKCCKCIFFPTHPGPQCPHLANESSKGGNFQSYFQAFIVLNRPKLCINTVRMDEVSAVGNPIPGKGLKGPQSPKPNQDQAGPESHLGNRVVHAAPCVTHPVEAGMGPCRGEPERRASSSCTCPSEVLPTPAGLRDHH